MQREHIIAEIEKGVEDVGEVIVKMPWRAEGFYSNWCAQTYKYVCHSAPLIKLCADVLPPGKLKQDMSHHYQDEVGHEKFAARDAEFFKLNAKEIEELPETAAIYSEIYDLIKANPSAMLGYGMALENVSKEYGPWISKVVCEHFGINPSVNHTKNVPASFLTLHADVDQEHAKDGIAALDQVKDEDIPFVIEVMRKTFKAYQSFLRGIAKRYA